MKIHYMEPDANFERHTEAAASPNGHEALSGRGATEEEIQAAVQGRDYARALALIDLHYGEGLHRFIAAMVRRPDRADDLYQTTLLEAFRDLATFGQRSSARTWLYGIARHRCLDALKMDRRREGRIEPAAELPEIADTTPGPAERLGDAELVAALGQCLDELSTEVRMVLLMRFQEGFGYEELARICRATPEAMRARVCRALPVLRRCIERKGAL